MSPTTTSSKISNMNFWCSIGVSFSDFSVMNEAKRPHKLVSACVRTQKRKGAGQKVKCVVIIGIFLWADLGPS